MCNKNFFFVVLRTFTGPVKGQKNNNISSPEKASCWLLVFISSIWLEEIGILNIHKLYKIHPALFPQQVLSHSITMAAAPQLINTGIASNTHHIFSLSKHLVMGCYFTARRDTIDHIENTQHNYNAFPWGLVLKPSNIWGCWKRGKEGDGPIEL